LLVCGACAFLSVHEALGDDAETKAQEAETKIKVAYVYNFPKFVDWPGDDKNKPADPIRICVIGTDPIRTMLGELSIRYVEKRPIKVSHVENADALSACHLLYVSRSEELLLPLLLQRNQGKPVLTVSDIPQFAQKGGMIGFVTEMDHVKIEINQGAVHQAGLKVRAKLLEIARIVP